MSPLKTDIVIAVWSRHLSMLRLL